jgi:FkbM family methyltransferase
MNLPAAYLKQLEEIRENLGTAWKPYGMDLALLLHLKWLGFQPRCIYDIGSSNSVWSTLANKVFPGAEMQLFEPLAGISDKYRASKDRNPPIARFMETARHQIHPVALGAKTGTCRFQWLESNHAGSTSLHMEGQMPGATIVDVPMHRLDDYVASRRLTPPDLIKLDTQGSEMEILAGAAQSLGTASVVFIECWLVKGYGANTPLFLEVSNHLYAAGFDLFAIGDEYRGADGVAQSKDAVFVRRDLPLKADPLYESHV